MDVNEKIEIIRLVFEICLLDVAIQELERKMKEKDGPRECNQDPPETQGD